MLFDKLLLKLLPKQHVPLIDAPIIFFCYLFIFIYSVIIILFVCLNHDLSDLGVIK